MNHVESKVSRYVPGQGESPPMPPAGQPGIRLWAMAVPNLEQGRRAEGEN